MKDSQADDVPPDIVEQALQNCGMNHEEVDGSVDHSHPYFTRSWVSHKYSKPYVTSRLV